MITLLNRKDPDQHIDRGYLVTVKADLFGSCCRSMVRSWGNRRTAYHGTCIQPMQDEDRASSLSERKL